MVMKDNRLDTTQEAERTGIPGPDSGSADLTAYIFGGPCCGNDSSSLLVSLEDFLEVENTPKQHVIGRETPTVI